MQIRSLTALATKLLVLALVLAGAAWAADSNVGTWKLNTANQRTVLGLRRKATP